MAYKPNTIKTVNKKQHLHNSEVAKDHIVRKKNIVLNKPTIYGPMWKPRDEKDILKLTLEMQEWSKLETSTNINDFPLMHDINPYHFKRIDNDYFQDSFQTAKFRIASRNRRLVNSKECDKDIYKSELYLLDQDYKEAEDEKIAKRVANAKEALGNITVVDHMLEEK